MKTLNKIFLLAIMAVMVSCDDIIEQDITSDIVQPISPVNSDTIESNVVTFQWNSLKDADKYRIQVYAASQAIVLDSVVSKTNFTHGLSPGHYQWRVRGENSAYESSYSFPMGFTLIASSNLENQQVILGLPVDATFTNRRTMLCTWNRLTAAQSYQLDLLNTNTGEASQNPGITATSFSLTTAMLAQDGEYQWKVKAVNADTETPFSTRVFSIDTAVPNPSVNSQPVHNSNQLPNIQINFAWSVATDTGIVRSPVTYTIEISNDAGFLSFTSHPNLVTPSYQEIFTTPGDYYWRVKTSDRAGNVSAYGTPSKFTINP